MRSLLMNLGTLGAAAVAGAVLALAGCSESQAVPSLKGSAAEHMDACVEQPTERMRRRHMDFLLHQRDETMHLGIRTKSHSLKNCVDCHTAYNEDNEPIPINAEGQFCNSCHAFAAVHLDCFECHATTPSEKPQFQVNRRLESVQDPAAGGKVEAFPLIAPELPAPLSSVTPRVTATGS